MQITIQLSDEIYQDFARLAQTKKRRVDEILTENLEKNFSNAGEISEPDFRNWTDTDVLSLAKLMLPEAQSKRMSRLLNCQNEGTITKAESSELEIYNHTYLISTLRKSQGIAEAVRRGLIKVPQDLK